jgi:hypothetical protein
MNAAMLPYAGKPRSNARSTALHFFVSIHASASSDSFAVSPGSSKAQKRASVDDLEIRRQLRDAIEARAAAARLPAILRRRGQRRRDCAGRCRRC